MLSLFHASNRTHLCVVAVVVAVVVAICEGTGTATFGGARGVGRTGLPPLVIQDFVLPARKVLRVPFAWTTSSLVALSSCRGISQLSRVGVLGRFEGRR